MMTSECNLYPLIFISGYNEKIPFVKPAPIDEQEAKKQKKSDKKAEPKEQ